MKRSDDSFDKLFPLFFLFCVILSGSVMALVIWAVIRLVLHFT